MLLHKIVPYLTGNVAFDISSKGMVSQDTDLWVRYFAAQQ